jgi:hypothetical protein
MVTGLVSLGLLIGINSRQVLAEITHKNDALSQSEQKKKCKRSGG